jgi:hypothetical protein
MADTTKPLPSPSVPVVDRLRRWSPEWYPFVKQLLTNIKTQAAAVFTIQETIDEIEGKWGIDITEGGKVRGAITLDASETLSTFAVLADRFTVSLPDGTGTKTVFAVGTVNGVSGQPGFDALMVFDGTILARHIVAGSITAEKIAAGTITADKLNVSTLSAIAANVGTVTAGVLRSADGLMVIDLNNKTIQITT